MSYSNIETLILNLKKNNINSLSLPAAQVSDASFIKLMEQGYGLRVVGRGAGKDLLISW